jgi:hypothetical protein
MNDMYIGLGLAFVAINFLAWTWLVIRFEKEAREKHSYRDLVDDEKHRYRDACSLKEAVIERRLALLELMSTTMPTHRDLNDIRESLGLVAQTVTGVRERLIVNTEMTRSIKKHLLENEP